MSAPGAGRTGRGLDDYDEDDEVHALMVSQGLLYSDAGDRASGADATFSVAQPLRQPHSDSSSSPLLGLGMPAGSPSVATPTFGRRMAATHTFSVRATVIGLVLGTLIVFQNMYFFLKSGLGFGGAFTASIVGWLAVRLLSGLQPGLAFSPMEHCYLMTVAVATGGGAIAFGFVGPVLAMTRGFVQNSGLPASSVTLDLSWGELLLYCTGLCTFGIFMAVPFRRKFILQDKLPFPSGRATAVLISSLQRGSERARRLGRLLAMAFVPSFLLKWVRWMLTGLDTFPLFGLQALCYNWMEDWSTAFYGSALLMPSSVPYGMAVGALAQTLIGRLTLDKQGQWYYQPGNPATPPVLSGPGPDGETCPTALGDLNGAYGYIQLTAVAMFFVDGFLLLGSTAYRAWFRRGGDGSDHPADAADGGALVSPESPNSVQAEAGAYPAGLDAETALPDGRVVLTPKLPSKGSDSFEIPDWWWQAGVATSVALTLVLVPTTLKLADSDEFSGWAPFAQTIFALVLAPLVGYVVVFTFGKSDQALVLLAGKLITAVVVLWSGSIIRGLSLAAVGACLSMQAVDTCQVMKSAHILRASPRVMLLGQTIGAVASIPVGITAFKLFTQAYVIPGTEFQAPLAQLFRAIAQLFEGGNLPLYYGAFLAVGSTYVVAHHMLGWTFGGRRWMQFLPLPFAVALGLYIPPLVAWDFCAGTVVKLIWQAVSRRSFEENHQAVSAGMIAGEGVAGVLLAAMQLFWNKPGLYQINYQ